MFTAASVRIVGGPTSAEGTVEIKYKWVTKCYYWLCVRFSLTIYILPKFVNNVLETIGGLFVVKTGTLLLLTLRAKNWVTRKLLNLSLIISTKEKIYLIGQVNLIVPE